MNGLLQNCSKSLKASIFLVFCWLTGVAGLGARQTQPALPLGEWHVLLIAATSDRAAGAANTASLHKAKAKVREMAKLMGMELHLHEVSGSLVTPEETKQAVRRLVSTPLPRKGEHIATVLSFTHGGNFNDTWTRLPFMACHPTDNKVMDKQALIAIEDIYELLCNRSAFQHVHVWSELCNNIPYGIDDTAPERRPFLDLRHNFAGGEAGKRLRHLLMGVPATVMASSSYGQISYALSDRGGFFTNSLFEALDAVANGTLAPQFRGEHGFFAFVRERTQRYTSQYAGALRAQTPQGYVGSVPRDMPIPASNILQASQSTPAEKPNRPLLERLLQEAVPPE